MRMIPIVFAISAVFAQNVEFDVASVKPAASAPFDGRLSISGPAAEQIGFEGGPGSKTPGRIHYSGVSLKMILLRAYGMRPYQISGPAWMETERYDIDAKYPPGTKLEDFRLMLQKLLGDRFHLVLHRETREMTRYRLVIAKGGPKLSPAQKQPEYKDDEERKAASQKQAKAYLEAMMRRPHTGPFHSLSQPSGTMAKLAESLSWYLDRPVTDYTGLEGSYSYRLEWSPDEPAAAAENSLPSIIAAVQEQLGLKLEPEKGPVEVLVIERAEKTPVMN
jgi:uncharacterized protein (TIGR03435 family)